MKENRNVSIAFGQARAVRFLVIAFVILLVQWNIQAIAQTTPSPTLQPGSNIEVGAGGVSDRSFKFGEYNGLENNGIFGIGSFDLRSNTAYDSNSTQRWRITGDNLGLENRNLSAEFENQGKFRFNFVYDELLMNRSDSYQTPYLGAGTSNLTLPANWVPPIVPQVSATAVNFRSFDPVTGTGSVYNSSGVLTPPTAAQLAALASIRAADVPAFHNYDIETKRTRFDAGVSFDPGKEWSIPISFSHEHKDGSKLLGAVSSQINEFSVTLPDPVDQDTDQINASVNYTTKKVFMTFAYYGSIYNNNIQSVTWQDVNDPTKSATRSSAPSNQFHQFSVTAGFKLSPKTKLVVASSYGRSTQNDAFLGPATAANGQLAFGLPAASLNGLIVPKTFDLKLTSQATKKWNLSAAYKLDDRDNQTPVRTYLFQDANEAASGVSPFAGLNGLPTTLGSNTNIYDNLPFSKKINQTNLQAERALPGKQWLQAGYDWQRIDRSCPGTWINCADVSTSNEHTLRAQWRTSMVSKFTSRVDYAYSWRRGNYNEDAFLALTPMANVVPAGGATVSLYNYLLQTGLTGFGPLAGLPTTTQTGNAAIFTPSNNIVPQALYGSRNNINVIPGERDYMESDRDRNKARASLNWQATDNFSLQGVGDFNYDNYVDATYGLQKGKTWAGTFDAEYSTGDLAADLYYTYEDLRNASAGDAYGTNSTTAFQGQAGNTIVSGGCYSNVADKNANAKIDPCLIWSKANRDQVDTLGFTLSRKNLVSDKLTFTADIVYTRARTSTAVHGGSYVNNPVALAAPAPPLPPGQLAALYIAASDFPLVRSDSIMVRPTATLALTKAMSLRVFYLFQRLMNTDYAYDGMQFGTGTNYLPTNEKPPNYGVHVASVSLTYTF